MTANDNPPLQTALAAVRAALERKPINPTLLHVEGLCSYADYLLILGGSSTRQVNAIAEAVGRGMRREGHKAYGTEGLQDGRWALLDFGDVVVHVFLEDVRSFYDLESLWADARRVELDLAEDPVAAGS